MLIQPPKIFDLSVKMISRNGNEEQIRTSLIIKYNLHSTQVC